MAWPAIPLIGKGAAKGAGAKKAAAAKGGATASTATETARQAKDRISDNLDADCERDGKQIVCDVDLGNGVTAEATFDIKRD